MSVDEVENFEQIRRSMHGECMSVALLVVDGRVSAAAELIFVGLSPRRRM